MKNNMADDIYALLESEDAKKEYRKAFLLNLFNKVCSKMHAHTDYARKVRGLFHESRNRTDTVKQLIRREFALELSDGDAVLMESWLHAHFAKASARRPVPQETVLALREKQNGRCASCNEPLNGKVHVDHIIPWTLVGDELEDNYQLLCPFCNESKSAKTDYIFKRILKLN